LAFVCIVTVGCGTMGEWEDVPLTGDDLNALVPGNTLRGSFNAEVLVMFFDTGGTVRGTLRNSPDSGEWWIRGDEYCHKWVRLFGAMERCYQWYPPVSQGGRYLLRSSSAFRGKDIRGRIVEGNQLGS
jgi:hypothetical protein